MPSPAHLAVPDGTHPFPHRHLLGIAGLRPWEIAYLLDEAEQWIALNRATAKHDDRLAGLTQINAFFENSTRTLLSFEIAGKRLGADVVNMHAAQSSVKKGETLIDTAVTLNAMRPDVIVIRHDASGAVALIADEAGSSATSEVISMPRFIGPGCITSASGAADARRSRVSP